MTERRPSYKRGTALQAPLAVLGSVLAFFSWWLGKSSAWLIGGAILLAVVPFTLVVIFPTNKKLESNELDVSSAQAENLLRLWVDSTLSAAGLVSWLS